MTDEARVVEVKIDPELHQKDPEPGMEETWAVLDTAYNLLRDEAVRVTIGAIRKQAAEQGHAVPEDAILFAHSASQGVRGHRDLAPNDPLAARGIFAVYEVLLNVALGQAQVAIDAAQEDGE